MIDLNERVRFSPRRPVMQELFSEPEMRVLLFGLEAGQEIPPHVNEAPVCFYVADGEGRIRIGERVHRACAGRVLLCPAGEPHGFGTDTRLVLLAVIGLRAPSLAAAAAKG